MTMWTLRPLSLGEVLDTTVGVYRKAFVPLLLVTLATQGLPLLWGLYSASGEVVSEGFTMMVIRWLITLTLGALGSAASTFIVAEAYLGRDLTMGDAFQRSVPFIGRILLTGLFVSLVAFVGLLFLFVPGVIVFCGFLLSTPALVLEDLPGANDAMGRSWRLTSGLRGRIFVVLLVGMLLLFVPVMGIGALSAMLADPYCGGSVRLATEGRGEDRCCPRRPVSPSPPVREEAAGRAPAARRDPGFVPDHDRPNQDPCGLQWTC